MISEKGTLGAGFEARVVEQIKFAHINRCSWLIVDVT
jgi:hypothetical protein